MFGNCFEWNLNEFFIIRSLSTSKIWTESTKWKISPTVRPWNFTSGIQLYNRGKYSVHLSWLLSCFLAIFEWCPMILKDLIYCKFMVTFRNRNPCSRPLEKYLYCYVLGYNQNWEARNYQCLIILNWFYGTRWIIIIIIGRRILWKYCFQQESSASSIIENTLKKYIMIYRSWCGNYTVSHYLHQPTIPSNDSFRVVGWTTADDLID